MSSSQYEVNQLPEIGDIVYINNEPYIIWRMPNSDVRLVGLNEYYSSYYYNNPTIEQVMRQQPKMESITLRDGTPVFIKVNPLIKCGDIIEWNNTEYVAVCYNTSWMFVSKAGTRLMSNICSPRITIDDVNRHLNMLPEAVLLDKKWE